MAGRLRAPPRPPPLSCDALGWVLGAAQDKKKAEEARKKELADLFALTIKQPKVPVGASHTAHPPRNERTHHTLRRRRRRA